MKKVAVILGIMLFSTTAVAQQTNEQREAAMREKWRRDAQRSLEYREQQETRRNIEQIRKNTEKEKK